MRLWVNVLGYQAVWLIAVIGAANGTPWPGLLAAPVFVVWQWLASGERAGDVRLVACAVLLGVALDGALAGSGLLRYAAQVPAALAPLWILAIWAAFAMTLNHSLAFLKGRIAWAALLGVIGGPLAYLGAARGFHAVEFVAPAWRAFLTLALGWAIALPVLVRLSQHWSSQRDPYAPMETTP